MSQCFDISTSLGFWEAFLVCVICQKERFVKKVIFQFFCIQTYLCLKYFEALFPGKSNLLLLYTDTCLSLYLKTKIGFFFVLTYLYQLYFWLIFAQYLFLLFYFQSFYVCLESVFCIQYISGLCYLIHSANLSFNESLIHLYLLFVLIYLNLFLPFYVLLLYLAFPVSFSSFIACFWISVFYKDLSTF